MTEFIHTIQNWNNRWIGRSALLLILVGNFFNSWVYFIILVVLVAVVSTIRYFHDRKWLKEAERYIRLSIKTPFWLKAVEFVLTTSAVILVVYQDSFFDRYIHEETMLMLLITSMLILFGDHFQKFVNSVKSLESGIQLPGRNQEVIPWKEVYEFNFIEEERILISSSKGQHQYYIQKEDPEHVEAMISDWKQRNGRRN